MLLYRIVASWLWDNPVARRIVGGAGRRADHLAVRMGVLLVGVTLTVGSLLYAGVLEPGVELASLAAAGTRLFALLAYAQVLGVCLLAPLFMAGAIASERQGRTWDVLLTTPLSNLQVVLGSLLGRLFFVFALLTAWLPLVAVLPLFGGVRPAAVAESFAVAAATATLVGAVAVSLSVARVGGRAAVYGFVVAVAALLAGGYALDRLLLRPLNPTPYTTWLTGLHPLLVLESRVLGEGYRPPPAAAVAGLPGLARWFLTEPLQAYLAWTLGLAACLVLASAVLVRRLGQGLGGLTTRLSGPLGRALRLGRGSRDRPAREVTGNPVAWAEANTRGKMALGILARWGFTLGSLAAAAGLLLAYHGRVLPELPPPAGGAALAGVADEQVRTLHAALSVLLLAQVAVVSLVAVYLSAGAVSREREDGTLDVLLTTPITPADYVWGKLRGLVRFLAVLLAAPVGTLGLAGGYALVAWLARDAGGYPHRWVAEVSGSGAAAMVTPAWVVLPEAALLLALVLVPFVALCVAVGMAWSLRSRGVLSAVTATLGVIAPVVLVTGLCGAPVAGRVPLLGPMLNALSPATGVPMLVNPYGLAAGFPADPSLGRIVLLAAATLAAGVYGVVVYGLVAHTVSTFDQTLRATQSA
ncbi:ABC transporter permease subunit [Phycisphaera mikurensis]|uniref:Hypothetical membrane protein n=1 Tax=Phycisphaera mikurensis (strain NBRC 102666 / KCTC 22515 / FYK2301M01) TaxID=1142394 RepID=I0II67_PHYMF|nr:ABC transporter permease subunit [Phycisphaera mikurensis]MBB6442482.1 ABC-type transport system involved in multi-copper enzyme maturation permease subunit [Phycisphaera mikurensis]BAM04955.1 hypothetical membrane protein [Phycisphaera mikurensis NBRC 102666]